MFRELSIKTWLQICDISSQDLITDERTVLLPQHKKIESTIYQEAVCAQRTPAEEVSSDMLSLVLTSRGH